jgi:lipopolysaccharide transport system ATP-binding protein
VFGFTMPILKKGDYSVCAAIAEGTQENHVQLHWMHDALMFRCDSSAVANGLIGIPMHMTELHLGTTEAAPTSAQ